MKTSKLSSTDKECMHNMDHMGINYHGTVSNLVFTDNETDKPLVLNHL